MIILLATQIKYTAHQKHLIQMHTNSYLLLEDLFENLIVVLVHYVP